MTAFRAIVAIAVILFAAYIVVMNWGCVIATERNRRKGIKKHHSTVPLISLFLAWVAYPIYPFEPKGWIGIIPALDIGNWYLLVLYAIALFRGILGKKPPDTHDDGNK